MARNEPRDVLNLFYGLNLLDEKRPKLELFISRFDGVFVGAIHVDNIVTVNQDEFPFVRNKLWQLLFVGLQFLFECNGQVPKY